MPKVSVIIPVYNVEKYLRKCLDSIINQTLKDIEIICVNDCSPDNSLDILKEYTSKDNRIKIINFEENEGVSVARNTGIESANGDYISFIDPDDYIDTDFYEKLYSETNNCEIEVIKGNLQIISDDKAKTTSINSTIHNHQNNVQYFTSNFSSAIYKKNFLINNNILFPTNIIIGEDICFLQKVAYCAKSFKCIDNTFYNYVRRSDSVDSNCYNIEKLKVAYDTFEYILDNANNFNKSHQQTDTKSFITFSLQSCINCLEKCDNENSLNFAVNRIFEIHEKIQEPNNIYNKLNAFYEYELKLLKNKDIQNFINFYKKNNTPKKLYYARLRNKIQKGNI